MKSNDEASSAKTIHALEWISILVQTPISTLTIAEIFQQRHLISILSMVDNQYFQCLEQLQTPNFLDVLILIEDYIEHILKQQFKRRFWNQILKNKSFLQLLSLIVYVAVHSPNKIKFIPSILQLPADIQTSIKSIIEQTSSFIQSQQSVNTISILNKVDQLELENQQLKDQIVELQNTIYQIEDKYKLLEKDYYYVENQCMSLKKQKSFVCKELQLNQYDDFVEKYRILEKDLDEAYEQLKNDEDRIKELQNAKIDNKARIIGDGQIIEELNEQLKTARGLCKSLRMSSCLQSPVYKNYPIVTSRTLKQNIPVLNLPKRQNQDDICSHRKKLFNFLNNSDDQLQDEVLRLRNLVDELKDKNQCLNEQVLSLKQINQNHRIANNKLAFTNVQRKHKLMELQSLYNEFRQEVLSN